MLTTRELVAAMTRNGSTPRIISQRLGISTQMVYKHLRRLGMGPVTTTVDRREG